jgi:hypothetical protein
MKLSLISTSVALMMNSNETLSDWMRVATSRDFPTYNIPRLSVSDCPRESSRPEAKRSRRNRYILIFSFDFDFLYFLFLGVV